MGKTCQLHTKKNSETCSSSVIAILRRLKAAVLQFAMNLKAVKDLSVQLMKCYIGQLCINIPDKATSVIAIMPK